MAAKEMPGESLLGFDFQDGEMPTKQISLSCPVKRTGNMPKNYANALGNKSKI
jgi:hypothetical protein